jgi:hypothetical protein
MELRRDRHGARGAGPVPCWGRNLGSVCLGWDCGRKTPQLRAGAHGQIKPHDLTVPRLVRA